MRLLKPLLAIYGAGIAGTFAWLFLALSGVSACAAGLGVCRTVVGLSGEFALIWPAYWGGRLTGEPVAQPEIPMDLVFAAVLVFAGVMIFAKAETLFDMGANKDETAPEVDEHGRRDQSVMPPVI